MWLSRSQSGSHIRTMWTETKAPLQCPAPLSQPHSTPHTLTLTQVSLPVAPQVSQSRIADVLILKIILSWCHNSVTAQSGRLQGGTRKKRNPFLQGRLLSSCSPSAWKSGGPWLLLCPSVFSPLAGPGVPVTFVMQRVSARISSMDVCPVVLSEDTLNSPASGVYFKTPFFRNAA